MRSLPQPANSKEIRKCSRMKIKCINVLNSPKEILSCSYAAHKTHRSCHLEPRWLLALRITYYKQFRSKIKEMSEHKENSPPKHFVLFLHRIIKQLKLKGTLKIIELQPSSSSSNPLSVNCVLLLLAWSCYKILYFWEDDIGLTYVLSKLESIHWGKWVSWWRLKAIEFLGWDPG